MLDQACRELARVTKQHLIVGVPYRQDIRVGRTTCSRCGKINPPWGHVNSFDDDKLTRLFSGMTVVKCSFVGETSERTNWFSSSLMDLAGNPYGTYSQDERCIHCNASIGGRGERALWQKVLTKTAFLTTAVQKSMLAPHPNWIHLVLSKNTPR